MISNCVINLAADKSLVLRDAFRVLKPGGRFAVSDVVADGPVPEDLRQNMEAWVGCLLGRCLLMSTSDCSPMQALRTWASRLPAATP